MIPESQRHVQLFDGLSPDVRADLSKVLRVLTFSAGESIFAQNAPATAIYIVASGRVKIVRVTSVGDEIILCVRQAGEYFCPVTVLDGKPQLGESIAMTDVTILWAERQAFLELSEKHPCLLSVVQGACLLEIRHLVRRLESRSFRNVKERLAHTLLTESRRKNGHNGAGNVVFLTQQELGNLIGASRESVSRTLARFERSGLVGLERGRVTLKDLDELERMAGLTNTAPVGEGGS